MPAVLIAAIAGAVTVFYMIEHKPAVYEPANVPDTNEVSPYLTHKLGPQLWNNVQFEEPFDLIIEEKGVNDIIAREPWPQHFGKVRVDTPAIVFSKGSILAMAPVSYSKLNVVMSARAAPVMDPNGRIIFNIDSVKAGVLDVTTLARMLMVKYVSPSLIDSYDEPWLEPLLEGIINNKPVEPVFDIYEYTATITSLKINDSNIIVHIVPEKIK